MAADVPAFTDASFDSDVLKSPLPVVVDLWADWCAPCRAIAPVIEALSKELKGKITIGKLDIMANPATPSKLGVTAIPTILLFKGGKEVGRLIGGGKTAGDFKREFSKAFGVAV
jgi:thioredoxin 1